MKILVALGGNALEDGAVPTAENQLKVIRVAATHLADMIEAGHELVISHGNGPQVGRILLQNEAAKAQTPVLPLDVCGAMTQGAIGYQIQQAMQSELSQRGIEKPVVTLLTQVVVDSEDSAFLNPTKPVGVFYSVAEVDALKSVDASMIFKEDAGRGWRRVVASPRPQMIQEMPAIQSLIQAGCVVIACGGGGIPVVKEAQNVRGVAAVIDKDFASALLAENLNFDVLAILTAVDQVAINYNKPQQRDLAQLSIGDAQRYIEEKQFAPGSMLPKVQAAVNFASSDPKRRALITSLAQMKLAMEGGGGTWISQN
ncbi:MAG: carbamate kinase [Spirochaetia bacterium]